MHAPGPRLRRGLLMLLPRPGAAASTSAVLHHPDLCESHGRTPTDVLRFARPSALAVTLAAGVLAACGSVDESEPPREPPATGRQAVPTAIERDHRREIAFTRDGETGEMFSEIHLMDADGANQVKLTHSPRAADEGPSFSPDGRRIAFTRQEGRDSAIYVIRVDGTGEEQLTDTPGKRDLGPAFSPDGKRIAFTSDRDSNRDRIGGPTSIYVMDADGRNETPITEGPRDGSPAWSPDGERIAFTRGQVRRGDSGAEIEVRQVWTMAADGSSQTRLRHGSGLIDVCCPAFSPDGERIAFLGLRPGASRYGLYAVCADGGEPTRLSDPPLQAFDQPAWSPDGKRIAFKASRPAPRGELSGIFVIDADGGNARHLPDTEGNDRDPAWSP
jgi:TolB protein